MFNPNPNPPPAEYAPFRRCVGLAVLLLAGGPAGWVVHSRAAIKIAGQSSPQRSVGGLGCSQMLVLLAFCSLMSFCSETAFPNFMREKFFMKTY